VRRGFFILHQRSWQEVKTSFCEKKEAKKLCSLWTAPLKPPVPQIKKSFLLLFYKKEALPSLQSSPHPAHQPASTSFCEQKEAKKLRSS